MHTTLENLSILCLLLFSQIIQIIESFFTTDWFPHRNIRNIFIRRYYEIDMLHLLLFITTRLKIIGFSLIRLIKLAATTIAFAYVLISIEATCLIYS